MTLSDDSWNGIVRCLSLRGNETENHMSTVQDVLDLFRDNWDLVCDHDAVTAFIAEHELAELRALRAKRLDDIDKIDAEIAKLQE